MDKNGKFKESGQQREWEQLSFEEALQRLEEIVDRLEDGEIPLEEAIDIFQEGMELSKLCRDKLGKIEQKIEMLLERDGEFVTKPFQVEEERE
ncbi:hypothetical protein BSNK01_06720 [Bacillaceae bacterium]